MNSGMSTKKLAPKQLIDYSTRRTEIVVSRLKKAMKEIEDDISSNDGLYPFNGGRLTQNEVCRRALVSNAILQSKGHKLTTKVVVSEWLKTVLDRVARGKRNVRRSVADRVDAWKDAHAKIAQELHLKNLIFEEANLRLSKLEEENAKLKAKLKDLGERHVLSFPSKK